MTTGIKLLLLAAVAQVAASERINAPFEWGGSFETPDAFYTWTMQNKDKAGYEKMMLVLLNITGDSDAALEAVAGTATAMMANSSLCTPTLPHGGGAAPLVPGVCYDLKIEGDDALVYSSLFRIATPNAYTAIFTEHVPTEFERSAHYFIDKDGVDIEPLHEKPEKPAKVEDYSGVWGATLTVNLCTLIGLLTLVPGIKGLMESESTRAAWLAGSSSFAAGALLAAAAFLMIPESVLLVNGKATGLEEGEAAARLGICLLCGFVVGLVVDVAMAAVKPPAQAEAAPPEKTDEETPGETEPAIAPAPAADGDMTSIQMRTATSIFVGDFLHNFGDGVFIGAAFKVCGNTMGWTVAWGAVAHELAQELADFFVLVGPAGMSWWLAIILNVLSGVSVVIGGLITYGSDIGDEATGLILVFGAGTYIYIGCAEAIPRAFTPEMSVNSKLLNLFLFIVGCAGIGFVLYGHEHCTGEGGHVH